MKPLCNDEEPGKLRLRGCSISREVKLKKTVINIRDIDWNLICKELRRERSHSSGKTAYWDKRAPSFARNASRSDYAGKFLRFVDIKPHWTVLDVGCAAGTTCHSPRGKGEKNYGFGYFRKYACTCFGIVA